MLRIIASISVGGMDVWAELLSNKSRYNILLCDMQTTCPHYYIFDSVSCMEEDEDAPKPQCKLALKLPAKSGWSTS